MAGRLRLSIRENRNIGNGLLQQLAIDFANIFVPENKNHFFDLVGAGEEFAGGFQRDLRRCLDRIAVGAATDRRKRYRLDSVFHRELQ